MPGLSNRHLLVTHFAEKVSQDSGNSCQYHTTQKFKEGLQQWLNFEPERWVCPIPLETDVVVRLANLLGNCESNRYWLGSARPLEGDHHGLPFKPLKTWVTQKTGDIGGRE